MPISYKKVLGTAALVLVSSVALQASAGSVTAVTAAPLGVRTQLAVSFADLNLSSVAGQQALYHRISRAAERVCGAKDLPRAGDLAQAARNADCYRHALAEAMAEALSSANQSALAAAR